MRTENKKPMQLGVSFEDHSREGTAILTSEPSPLLRMVVYLFACLMVSAFAWSFVGKADVIVKTTGSIAPEAEIRRVYAPVEGEAVDIYMTEGSPVSKGDVLVRINAPKAVDMANRAREAQLKLESAEKEAREILPIKLKAYDLRIALLEDKVEAADKEHERVVKMGIAKLAEEQKLELEKTKANREKAKRGMEQAERVWQQHERLYNSPGQGGISRGVLEEKKYEYDTKKDELESARRKIGKFEGTLNKEYLKNKESIRTKWQDLVDLQVQLESEKLKREGDKNRTLTNLSVARSNAEGSERVTFKDLDEDKFLLVRAPVSGILTEVAHTQAGDKVESKKPVAGIAPEKSRKVLRVNILETNRGFLKVGMAVKVKVNAFPYQRYGFIEGTLEYIAPAATYDQALKKMVYKGRIGLEQDYISVQDTKYPLQNGMTALTEIIVRKRRVIDLALDPLRNVAG